MMKEGTTSIRWNTTPSQARFLNTGSAIGVFENRGPRCVSTIWGRVYVSQTLETFLLKHEIFHKIRILNILLFCSNIHLCIAIIHNEWIENQWINKQRLNENKDGDNSKKIFKNCVRKKYKKIEKKIGSLKKKFVDRQAWQSKRDCIDNSLVKYWQL